MKEVNTENLCSFELGTQAGINVPIWIIVGFQQRDRQDSQKLNSDTFFRPPITSAQGIVWTEKSPDAAILLNYGDDFYFPVYGQIKEALRALTKDDTFQSYKCDNDFGSSNNGNDLDKIYTFST